jgi:OmpA-OmpF porin, OOP family
MDRFYVGADAGGLLTLDTRVKEFLGPVAPDTKLKLDPGVRVGFVGGYKFTDWFSLEGETGVMANNISSITGGNIDGDATLANVPFLLNARFQLPHGRCPITPYFGGGAGGSATILDFQNHAEINGNHLSGNDSDVVFAYQAFAGLRYAINDHMGIGVEYHYFATTGASYRADTFDTSSDRLALAGVQSHAITAAFDYHF